MNSNRRFIAKWMMLNIIFIFLIVISFLFSCTPQRRLERLIRKHPELLKEQQTIIIHDTIQVMIPGTKIDTLFILDSLRSDTVTIEKDQLTVKLWMIGDTIYTAAECDTVYKTVIREIPVKTTKIFYRKPRDGLIRWIWIIIALTGLAWMIRSIMLLYKKTKERFIDSPKNNKSA